MTDLLFDMDGTGNFFYHKVIDFINETLPGMDLSYNSVMTYNLSHCLPESALESAIDLIHSKDFFINLEIIPEYRQVYFDLKDMGFIIKFCTTPLFVKHESRSKFEKCVWIEKHFGISEVDNIIFSNDKTEVLGRYLIGDKPTIGAGRYAPSWKLILCTQPYNQYVPTTLQQPIDRIAADWSDWGEVMTRIGLLPKQKPRKM